MRLWKTTKNPHRLFFRCHWNMSYGLCSRFQTLYTIQTANYVKCNQSFSCWTNKRLVWHFSWMDCTSDDDYNDRKLQWLFLTHTNIDVTFSLRCNSFALLNARTSDSSSELLIKSFNQRSFLSVQWSGLSCGAPLIKYTFGSVFHHIFMPRWFIRSL